MKTTRKKIGNAIGVLLAVLLILFIAAGPILAILFIVIKDPLYFDLTLIYGVLAVSIYGAYKLALFAESLGKKK